MYVTFRKKCVSPCLSNDPLDKVALHQVFLRHVAVHSPTENAPYAAGWSIDFISSLQAIQTITILSCAGYVEP